MGREAGIGAALSLPARAARALGAGVLAVLASSLLVYAAIDAAPGDPLRVLSAGRTLTPEARESLRAQYHLGDPFLVRWWDWLTAALHGDLGRSLLSRQPVGAILEPRLATSALLVGLAALVMIAVGVAIGTWSAFRRGRLDGLVVAGTTVLLATPAFVVATLLTAVFAVGLGWFPVLGTGDGLADRLHHLVLPALALAAGGVGFMTRIARVSAADELRSEHLRAAQARGLAPRTLRRHVLRGAALPLVTAAGMGAGAMIAGAVVVENAFGIEGLGTLLVGAVTSRDLAVAQGVCLVLVVAFVTINTAIDLLAGVMARHGERGRG